MASTTLVTTREDPPFFTNLAKTWTNLYWKSFGRTLLLTISTSSVWCCLWGRQIPFGSDIQMESNTPQDSAALTLQIQTLTASMEELTRKNQELRLQLQQEENRSPTRVRTKRNNNEDSHKRDDYCRPNSSNKANSEF